MNVIIGFESGQMITAAGCTGFEVHAGGDICVLRKNDGSKITYNFRKILYICEDRALEGVSVSGGSDMSGAVTGRSGSGGSAADGSGSCGSAASGTGTSGRKSASGKK